MSGDPGQEHFADGITEDLITSLSRIRHLSLFIANSGSDASMPFAPARDVLFAYTVLDLTRVRPVQRASGSGLPFCPRSASIESLFQARIRSTAVSGSPIS
jgi:hypothetical protein